MSGHRNLSLVRAVVFGRGAFRQLDEILEPHRRGTAPMIFFVDHVFGDRSAFLARVPVRGQDELILADVSHDPTTLAQAIDN